MQALGIDDEPPFDLERPLLDRFAHQVRRHGRRLAVRDDDISLDYDELNALANRIAHAIIERALPSPANVGLLLAHGALVPAAALAVTKAGATWVQLHPRHPEERHRFILSDADIRLLLTDAQHLEQARVLATRTAGLAVLDVTTTHAQPSSDPRVRPPSGVPILIKYTSGSTGNPKGVCLSSRALLHAAMVYARHGDLRPDDRISALSAGIGATECYGALLNGASLLTFDVQRDGPDRLARWLDREEITWLQAVPTVFDRLAPSMPRRRFEAVRLVRLFGEPVTQTEWRHFCDTVGPRARLHVGLGSTEAMAYRTGLFSRSGPPTDAVLPLDRPVADKEVAVCDANGTPVPPGAVGEVIVRSAYLFDGYWRWPDLTAAVLTPDPHDPHRRVFRTGDLGRMFDDGRFVHAGRADRQVKVSGNRVELFEVEEALRRVSGIREAVVAPRRSRAGSVRLVAFCVADRPAPSASALRDVLRASLPDPMVPAGVVFLDALPSLGSGKVDRTALATRAAADATEHVPPQNAVEETLVEIWRRALAVDDVGIDDDLFLDLGGDSLAAVRILDEVAHVFGRELPLQVFHRATTVRGFAMALDDATDPAVTGGRLRLHADGAQPPLFGICGAFGHALRLLLIGRALGTEQPFVGLEPPGMDWEGAGCRSIESMAAHYAREIRALRPRGPYRLLGTSLGGLLAFEVAIRLQRDGADVDLLAMVDTAVPACIGPAGIDRVARRDFAVDLGSSDRVVARGATVARQHRAALDAYVLQRRFDGTIVYFKCLEPPVPPTSDRRRLWARFATEGVHTIPVPGGHGQFHREPQFSAVVNGLRAVLADRSTT